MLLCAREQLAGACNGRMAGPAFPKVGDRSVRNCFPLDPAPHLEKHNHWDDVGRKDFAGSNNHCALTAHSGSRQPSSMTHRRQIRGSLFADL